MTLALTLGSLFDGISGFPLAATHAGMMVRRLTPVECERLQGYPDDWTGLRGVSDSARYRMLGNSVAVPVVEYLMKRIKNMVEDRADAD